MVATATERACRVCAAQFLAEKRWEEECPSCAARRVESCRECGQSDPARYYAEKREEMLAKSLCFRCEFWLRWVAKRDDPSVVRVGAEHCVIGDEKAGGMRGFDGHQWRIEFFDGRVVSTTNLWSQSTIPDHFRDRLPPNAFFGHICDGNETRCRVRCPRSARERDAEVRTGSGG